MVNAEWLHVVLTCTFCFESLFAKAAKPLSPVGVELMVEPIMSRSEHCMISWAPSKRADIGL